MIHIYYANEGAESAENLQKRIRELGVRCERHHGGDFEKTTGDLCVNWGTSGASRFGTKCRWLNKGVYVDKLRHFQQMQRAGVMIPEFRMERPVDGTWYARMCNHMDGSDLERNLQHGDYYVQHVDIDEEYRVHVFRGDVLRASRKVHMPGTPRTKFRCGDSWGFSNRNYKEDLSREFLQQTSAAVEAIGYDFGGVDIATTAGGGVVVFEVNSAPWLGGEMQAAYARKIVALA